LSITRQLASYRLEASSRGYSEKTIAHVEMSVRLFTEFMGGIEDVSLVEGDDLRRFIVHLKNKVSINSKASQDRKISPTTVNTYVRSLRSFWSILKQRQAITTNPFADVPAPRFPKKVARIYSEDQLKSVLKLVVNKPRERAIIQLFLDSGIRLSELTGLMVEDLDLNQGTVKVMGKGSKERYSYFSPKTAVVINEYLDKRPLPRGDNYLFLTADGDQLSSDGVQSILRRIGEAANLTVRLTPHNLRHTYATLCLKNGSNLEYIRITLGHTDIKTTSDAYLAATQGDVALAYRKFSPMSNMNKKRK
jgi:site-specific recombinase XerD